MAKKVRMVVKTQHLKLKTKESEVKLKKEKESKEKLIKLKKEKDSEEKLKKEIESEVIL
jgi:hypothetical protein